MWHHESSCTGVTSTCCAGRRRSRRAGRDQRRHRAARGGRLERQRRRPRAAVVRDRRCRRRRAAGARPRRATAARPPPAASPAAQRLLDQRGDRHRAVLGRPAADHRDRLARVDGRADRGGHVGQPVGRRRRAASRASAGCAATISSVIHGGPARSSGNSSVCQAGSATGPRRSRPARNPSAICSRCSRSHDQRRRHGERAEQRPQQHARLARARRDLGDGGRIALERLRRELDGGQQAEPGAHLGDRRMRRRAAPARRPARPRARARAG